MSSYLYLLLSPSKIQVTVWVATPYYEAEVVHLLLPQQLQLNNFKEALSKSCSVVPDFCDDFFPTVPQLSNHHASFAVQPTWLRHTDRMVLVMDCSAIGGTTYAFYIEGPVNKHGLLRNLVDYQDVDKDFYLFGNHLPLLEGQSITAMPGGVVKVIPRHGLCEWAEELSTQMQQPGRWNSHVELPSAQGGLHIVYQATEDAVIEEIDAEDVRLLEVSAEEALQMKRGESVVYLPDERMPWLSHAGRRIWEQVAVLDNCNQPPEDSVVIFLDVRGLTCFPQWVQLTTTFFDPAEYVAGLQLPGAVGWTLMVAGGRACCEDNLIEVHENEVVSLFLKSSGDVPSSEIEDMDVADSGDIDSSNNSQTSVHLPHLSTGSGTVLLDDTILRDSPPHQPINRSRSPRRANCRPKELPQP